MNKCCYDQANLVQYGSRNKKVETFKGLLVVRYSAYMRCTVCGSKLIGEVMKNIHDRATTKKPA